MAILQLRYHTHDPSSPRLANQRLNWRYLSNILQKKMRGLLKQIYQIGTKMLNSKFFKFEDMDPTKKKNHTCVHKYIDIYITRIYALPHSFQNVTFRYQMRVWKNADHEQASETTRGTYPCTKPLLLKPHREWVGFLYA